jgi:hypothetical protein
VVGVSVSVSVVSLLRVVRLVRLWWDRGVRHGGTGETVQVRGGVGWWDWVRL